MDEKTYENEPDVKDEELDEEEEVEDGEDSELEDYLEDEDSDEDPEEEHEEHVPEKTYRNQQEVDQAIEKRLHRERKRLAKQLGVQNIEDIGPYLEAGRVVTRASGLNPKEVVSRMSQYGTNKTNPEQPNSLSNPALEEKIERIESMMEQDRKLQSLKKQEADAKKEFGNLFDEYKEDIEDKAEDLGVSLLDASAIVLRSQLKGHAEEQSRKKRDVRKKRKVESSDATPPKKESVSSRLSEAQKAMADRYGVSHEAYYKQLKRRGKV